MIRNYQHIVTTIQKLKSKSQPMSNMCVLITWRDVPFCPIMEVLEAIKISKPRGLSKAWTLASNQQAAKRHYLQTHIYILLECWTITRGTKLRLNHCLHKSSRRLLTLQFHTDRSHINGNKAVIYVHLMPNNEPGEPVYDPLCKEFKLSRVVSRCLPHTIVNLTSAHARMLSSPSRHWSLML